MDEPRYKLLVVDDHEESARVLARLLRMDGYEVAIALGVHSALELCRNAQFDLVISDIGLADGTGNELMRTLKQQYGLRGIAYSGLSLADDMRDALAAGFDEFVLKPASPSRLSQSIRNALDGPTPPPPV